MGTNCVPLVADLFCSVMRETSVCPFQKIINMILLKSRKENPQKLTQLSQLSAFNFTSRYLNDLLNIDNDFFDSMVSLSRWSTLPSELQLNKANVSDTEASFLDLHLSISDGFVKTKISDKRDDFDFDIVNFPFLMVMFLVRHPMGFIFLNLFNLLECSVILMTLILVIRF